MVPVRKLSSVQIGKLVRADGMTDKVNYSAAHDKEKPYSDNKGLKTK